MRRTHTLLSLLLLTACSATAGALFPQKVSAYNQSFEKLGEYRYVYRMFFRLYEAALFTESGANAEDVLNASASFHLQFRYLRKIDKEIILESADQMLERNLSREERAAIADRVDLINEAYTTVHDGYISSLTYKPGIGTILTINGKQVATIEGKDFAQLYFSIWLGEQGISDRLRDNLLGRN